MAASNSLKKIWWLYFVLYLLLVGYNVFENVQSMQRGFGLGYTTIPSATIDVCCLAGLFFYIQRKPAFPVLFWQFLFFIFSALWVIGLSMSLLNFFTHTWNISIEQWLLVFFSPSFLLRAIFPPPMIYALWFYAFRSNHLWSKPSENLL
jgi:hypothetical protein